MLICIRCTSGRNQSCNAPRTIFVRDIIKPEDVSWERTSKRLETPLKRNARKHAQRTQDAWVLSSSRKVVKQLLAMPTGKGIAYLTVVPISISQVAMLTTIRCISGGKVDLFNAHLNTLKTPRQIMIKTE